MTTATPARRPWNPWLAERDSWPSPACVVIGKEFPSGPAAAALQLSPAAYRACLPPARQLRGVGSGALSPRAPEASRRTARPHRPRSRRAPQPPQPPPQPPPGSGSAQALGKVGKSRGGCVPRAATLCRRRPVTVAPGSRSFAGLGLLGSWPPSGLGRDLGLSTAGVRSAAGTPGEPQAPLPKPRTE